MRCDVLVVTGWRLLPVEKILSKARNLKLQASSNLKQAFPSCTIYLYDLTGEDQIRRNNFLVWLRQNQEHLDAEWVRVQFSNAGQGAKIIENRYSNLRERVAGLRAEHGHSE